MKFFLVILQYLLIAALFLYAKGETIDNKQKPTAVAVVFWSSVGVYNFGINDGLLAEAWAIRLLNKQLDPTWPVNSSVEVVDVASNATIMMEWTLARMANTSLPPVSVFVFNIMGIEQMEWFEQFKIPCILCNMNANEFSQNVEQGSAFNYTYFIEPAVQYYFRDLAVMYKQAGVETLVVIADLGDYVQNPDINYSYSRDSCIRTANELMEPNGIKLLQSFTYYIQTATREDYESIISQTMALDPDAVMVCDFAATIYPDMYSEWIVGIMREMDYLPRALNIQDIYGTKLGNIYLVEGTLEYMTQVTFSHPKLAGIDFTEVSAPYASEFAPAFSTTVEQDINRGSNIAGDYSSAKIFADWYKNQTDIYPSYFAAGIWGTYDLIESAMYHASLTPSVTFDGAITGSEMFTFIAMSNVPTPYGRIIFDHNRVNTESFASVMQFFQSNDTEIVAPNTVSTHGLVYPMPKWNERVYKWSIVKGEVPQAIIIGAICTVILLTILITISIYRNQMDIKMLSYLHLLLMLVSSIIFLWAVIFVWQADMNQSQCNAYLWTIFLPASFVIQLFNMKAYRLSVFITSDSVTRKKKLTHNRILYLTGIWVSLTIILLLIAQLVDPPKSSVIISDQYRPSTNYYVCRHGSLTAAILYFLVVEHILVSCACVYFVRNGFEAFRDGLIMKEAFILLFGCIIVTYVFSQLGLSNDSFYFLRVLFLGIGITIYNVRLLFSRCARHWLTERMALFLLKYYKIYQEMFPKPVTTDNKVSAIELYSNLSTIEDDPLFKSSNFCETSDIKAVLKDEKRLELLRELAAKGLLSENLEFLETLEKLPTQYENKIVTSSDTMSYDMYEIAKRIYDKFCIEGSEKEVNISDSVRQKLGASLKSWPTARPIISSKMAQAIIEEDILETGKLFDAAANEIRQVLRQNLWTKFKTMETEMQMG